MDEPPPVPTYFDGSWIIAGQIDKAAGYRILPKKRIFTILILTAF